MDSEAFLNQISRSNRKVRGSNKSFFNSIIFKVLVGIVLGVTIFMIFSSILSSDESVKDKLTALKLHTTNLSKTISTYQPNVKSSSLRSYSASLNSVLTNTTNGLTEYMTKKYKAKDDKNVSKKISKKEEDLTKKLEEDLFNAKINGLLDRTFASKMAYEITVVSTRSKDILKLTKNEDLKDIINTSLNSLDNLYNNFNNYSEAK